MSPGDAGEMHARPGLPRLGSVVGESYRLVKILGAGGAGTVFEAEHLRLPRRFAIKVLHPGPDGRAHARFRREAETIAALHHPHIVQVFDYAATAQGAPYMVMELLEGETLLERLRRGQMPIGQVVELLAQTADAVAAAHQHGVIHRDLKPENLFLRRRSDGAIDVQVLDFGSPRSSASRSRRPATASSSARRATPRPSRCGATGR